MNPFEYRQIYKRNLPHRQPPGATLFVTFRLTGSIPESVLEQWRIEKKRLEMTFLRWAAIAPIGTVPDPVEITKVKLQFQRRWFKKFEEVLDCHVTGPLWLQSEALAEIVVNALRQRDGAVYRLDAYCVMPNHVHTVFAPYLPESLAKELAEKAIQRKRQPQDSLLANNEEQAAKVVLASIMQSLKGWTARQCNLVLQRRGQFWQHESFDHVIQDQAEYARIIAYVMDNPVKAGHVANSLDWNWSYCRPAPESDANPTPE